MDSFFDWVDRQRNSIDKLCRPYRRVLLLSLLDTLSKCAYPKTKGNKKRFLKLINKYSKWNDKDRISLPQLDLSFSKKRINKMLKEEVKKRLSSWPKGQLIRPSDDPFYRDLAGLANTSEKKIINKHRYSHLLWNKRNFAVHEFRTPGKGWPLSNDNTSPYYHGFIGDQTFHLVMPLEFISQIVMKCNTNLKLHLDELGIDPLGRLSVRDLWL